MKKHHYIAIIAAIAIVCIQTNYIKNLYNSYRLDSITKIENDLHIAIDYELHIRNLEPQKPDEHSLVFKAMKDMTPQEKDSLLKITKPGDTINIDEARENKIGSTVGEIVGQISQDIAMNDGKLLNVQTLDSIYISLSQNNFTHRIITYDKDKFPIDSVDYKDHGILSYTSDLRPIGTKGLLYLQIKSAIPISNFILHQLWNLIASVCIVLIVLSCLVYQLIEIKRKNDLLAKREASINGTIHDLKAPLNSVITMLSWFKSVEKDAQKRDLMDTGQTNVKHLVYTIESLLICAKQEQHKIILNKTEINILSLVETAIQELSFLFPDKHKRITIINKLPTDFRIAADAMYIENVIRNLLENALKYSDEEVQICVTLEVESGKLQVSVKDNGWGIAPQYQKKLFTQFYQVPRQENRRQKGYGIGLAQAKHIINEHKGEIKVVSTENRGSLFTFTLPF